MDLHDVLHYLRNPYGKTAESVREAMHQAADMLEAASIREAMHRAAEEAKEKAKAEKKDK